ncbi:potassium voltage-gated channel subfamily A member 1-like [Mizuhopecten yessoensis]|uniref:Potassium voltage-gated channel subfamily A member 1 n=1 Tax=Mizuhopecten yessoensis TaxID=6573 RepID=A0A210R4B4_MIZYE|nr:potassium voltage-gated channel subfamily A member 1-like [Mizuhopecten yessoensis]OWF55857.1 Potassium voltage-gated channel subfamily A member 1 [Mizuhopecten yessoensis]
MQFVITPKLERRHLGDYLGDLTKLRRSPADFAPSPLSLLRGFEDTHRNEHTYVDDKGTSVSEDEGLELSSENISHPVDWEHNCAKEGCHRVKINVSGLQFETQLKTLNRLPNTLLGNPFLRERYWDFKRKEYFFDRHRPSFQAILYFYQSGGRLKRPYEVPLDVFIEELKFFGFDKDMMDEYKQSEGCILKKECPLPENKKLKAIWQLFEHPSSSIGARLMSVLSVGFILLSIGTFCMETVPEFASDTCVYTNINLTENNSSKQNKLPTVTINYGDHFFIMESVCVAWFIFELLMRFISCPSKRSFIKHILHWVDLVSVLPHLVFVGTYCLSGVCIDSHASNAVAVLRILRVTRVLKLGKHSEGLQILALTIANSFKELLTFVAFLAFGVVIFSAAMFHSERFVEGTHFESIPGTFWWSVVSMTTVGYGDMFPQGTAGKIVGTFTVIGGILTIALPVPIVVTNFNCLYNSYKSRASMY